MRLTYGTMITIELCRYKTLSNIRRKPRDGQRQGKLSYIVSNDHGYPWFLLLKIHIKAGDLMSQSFDLITKYSYLVGQKINSWTVLHIENNRRHVDAFCECECGTQKLVGVTNLINGLSKNCGCGRKKMLKEIKTKDLTGQKFGKLTVMELLPESNKFNRRQYRCLCDCGKEVIVPSSSLISNHTSSCGCLVSYYNAYISELLDKKKIEYKAEYLVFIDDHHYRFDFYLPKYNLCIEYDGQQHFEPRFFIGKYKSKEIGEKKLQELQQRDIIKNEYCKKNNINLLRIPYWESKNIETIIDNYLQRLNERDSVDAA